MPRDYKTPLPVDVQNTTPIPVSATFTPSGTQDVNVVSPNPLPVSGTFTVTQTVAFSNVSRVISSITNQILVAANPLRKGLLFYNDSTSYQYVKMGILASSIDFTVRLVPQVFYEVAQPIFIGQIDVISSSTSGAIQVTEFF